MAINLVFFNKSGRRKDVPLKSGVTVVGRRIECDVRIPVSYVSRKHCRIVNQDDQTLVQDLGSANGTFLNSQRIMEAVIKAGDLLAIGPVVFTIQIDGEPIEIAQPEKTRMSGSGTGLSGAAGEAPTEIVNGLSDLSGSADLNILSEDEPLADFDDLDDSSA